MDEPITVLIVDDHEVVRQGIRAYLGAVSGIEIAGEASCGEEAVELAQRLVPDVALVDLIMPGMDGIEATRRIKSASPRTQVVVLTSYHQDEHIFPALRAGAISYVLKDITMDDLVETIHQAVRGHATLHPQVAARVIEALQGGERETENPFTVLTERELQVLKLVANGLSNRDIAEELTISEYTVKGHVSNILSKLHLVDRTQAAAFAWQQGIVRRTT